ncbi:MAG: Ldh family oxidoreductase [Alphaproteobacteria bacterium]|nr:Ldh family oxidoreductase [Alphaproteobacteria bacterium]
MKLNTSNGIENLMIFTANELHKFAAATLEASGFTREESLATADSLILSNLMGYDSHGVVRVIEYIESLEEGAAISGMGLSILNDTANGCAADGQLCLGQVQMPRLLDHLFKKTEDNSVVTGTIRNCGHIGRLGEWVERIAEKGFVGLIAVNDNGALQCVAPPGGKEARTSTNPIAFGIPLARQAAFTLDISTSSVAIGKIKLSYLSGEKCAPGLIQNSDGITTINPAVLFEEPTGALLPMGGYKGFGLSMIVDCMVAGLSGGFTPPAPEGTPLVNNVLVGIWNPEKFSGIEHMQEQAEKYLNFVRQTKPTNPEDPVRVPGDWSKTERVKRTKNGIPLTQGVVDALNKKAEQYFSPSLEEFFNT